MSLIELFLLCGTPYGLLPTLPKTIQYHLLSYAGNAGFVSTALPASVLCIQRTLLLVILWKNKTILYPLRNIVYDTYFVHIIFHILSWPVPSAWLCSLQDEHSDHPQLLIIPLHSLDHQRVQMLHFEANSFYWFSHTWKNIIVNLFIVWCYFTWQFFFKKKNSLAKCGKNSLIKSKYGSRKCGVHLSMSR